jgi:hypothetical protein
VLGEEGSFGGFVILVVSCCFFSFEIQIQNKMKVFGASVMLFRSIKG